MNQLLSTDLLFHDATGEVIATWQITTTWHGNRYLTMRAMISQVESFYAYLAYHDDEDAEAGLYFACGKSAVDFAQTILSFTDWKRGALTCRYLDPQRRERTAVFTLNAALGDKLSGGQKLYVTDANKAFAIAFGA
jgi:hypothetical protein